MLSASPSVQQSNSLFDTDLPCKAIYITQPFSPDQIQLSRSFHTLLYRFLMKRPVAPKSMSVRFVVKYCLMLLSLLDLFCGNGRDVS